MSKNHGVGTARAGSSMVCKRLSKLASLYMIRGRSSSLRLGGYVTNGTYGTCLKVYGLSYDEALRHRDTSAK